ALGAVERRPQHRVAGERAVRAGVVDARQVLTHDGAGAEVEVADLGVAHLPVRQSYRTAAGGELRVRIRGPQLVEDGRGGERDGVARAGRRKAPAVEHDEQ